ncbi:hypothetical protein GGR56DRAFT_642900 [Xylariaceae sp. FL0804]|nr:hypothetical protein GGR56DRAFT_642900 [Xylariaceae sp. FL0804]
MPFFDDETCAGAASGTAVTATGAAYAAAAAAAADDAQICTAEGAPAAVSTPTVTSTCDPEPAPASTSTRAPPPNGRSPTIAGAPVVDPCRRCVQAGVVCRRQRGPRGRRVRARCARCATTRHACLRIAGVVAIAAARDMQARLASVLPEALAPLREAVRREAVPSGTWVPGLTLDEEKEGGSRGGTMIRD